MIMLRIGSLEIPTLAALEIEQSYEQLGGESIFRTVNGTGLKQETWRRTAVSTSSARLAAGGARYARSLVAADARLRHAAQGSGSLRYTSAPRRPHAAATPGIRRGASLTVPTDRPSEPRRRSSATSPC